MSYQLLPAVAQPTLVTTLRISVKAIFQAIPHAKVQTVTCHARRVAAGFPKAEVIVQRRGLGLPPGHIPNIAEFQALSDEKITRIDIPGSCSRARLRAYGEWRYWDKGGIFPGKNSTNTEDYNLLMSVLQAKKTVSK